MDGGRGRSKAAIAAEAWAALLDLTMGQRGRFFRILQEFGLTPGDLRALFALDGDHPRPMRALAQAWDCDASNATWMVDRLEARGLVERRALPHDRRVKAVVLTPLGASTKRELFTRLHEPPDDFLALDRATLEARGLVERRALPHDRRVKAVVLTPVGASTKRELFTRLHEPPDDFLALDRATLEALRDALAQLPASLRAPGRYDWPPHAPERAQATAAERAHG